MTLLLAAMRDASFYDSPGRASRYHVVLDGDLAACNSTSTFMHGAMALNLDDARRACDVDPILRCRRPGCARLWPVEVNADA